MRIHSVAIRISLVSLWTICGFVLNNLMAQQSYAPPQPQPIPCVTLTPADFPGTTNVSNAPCIDTDNNSSSSIDIVTNQNMELSACDYIHLAGETKVGPYTSGGSSGDVHMKIEPGEFELAWFSPTSTPSVVPIYEKLEIGVQLSGQIQNQVDNFLDNTMGNRLNPFDPDDINIQATFQNLNDPSEVIHQHGFYYKEYIYSCSDPSDLTTCNHQEVGTNYPFRIRVSPTKVGEWRATISLVINNQYIDHKQFTFNVSSNPSQKAHAYLKVTDNNRYLEDENGLFFPVGMNMAWPTCPLNDPSCNNVLPVECPYDPNNQDYPLQSCSTWEQYCGSLRSHLTPLRTHVNYREDLSQLSQSGANFFRLMVTPWTFEVEFEEIGNYNVNNRLSAVWELDRVIDHCNYLDIRVLFNLSWGIEFLSPGHYGISYWDWDSNNSGTGIPDPGYCYNSELGLSDFTDFLNSSAAREAYQNRIRYYISRYGYSTNIGIIELINEINNKGPYALPSGLPNPFDPNFQESVGFQAAVADWQNSMSEFIKDELNHTEHLISVNYAGPEAFDNMSIDNSYTSPWVDIVSYNAYNDGLGRERQWGSANQNYMTLVNKPIFNSEYGSAPYQLCDGGAEWIKNLWGSSFTGTAGCGLNWNGQNITGYDIWPYFQGLKDFMDEAPLDKGDWEIQSGVFGPEDASTDDEHVDQILALQALVKNVQNGSNGKAIGVIYNRTYNWKTENAGTTIFPDCWDVYGVDTDGFRTIDPCQNFVDEDQNPDKLDQGWNYEGYTSIFDDRVKLEGIGAGNYTIEYYKINDGQTPYIISFNSASSITDNLKLFPPDLLANTPENAIIAFKVYPTNGSFKSSSAADSISLAKNISSYDRSKNQMVNRANKPRDSSICNLLVMPNPSSNWIRIESEFDNQIIQASILSVEGELIKKIKYHSDVLFDISNLAEGLYLLQVQFKTGEICTKQFVRVQ